MLIDSLKYYIDFVTTSFVPCSLLSTTDRLDKTLATNPSKVLETSNMECIAMHRVIKKRRLKKKLHESPFGGILLSQSQLRK